MPFTETDWKDETIPVVDAKGKPVPTGGWACEMHIRSRPGMGSALLKLSTAAGTLVTGQATPGGSSNGIRVNVAAALMTMDPQTFVWDVKRIDGGRNEWITGGDGTFSMPVTVL